MSLLPGAPTPRSLSCCQHEGVPRLCLPALVCGFDVTLKHNTSRKPRLHRAGTSMRSQMGTQALDSVSSALPTSSTGPDSRVPSTVETFPKQEADGKINIHQELGVMGPAIRAPRPATAVMVIPGAVRGPAWGLRIMG